MKRDKEKVGGEQSMKAGLIGREHEPCQSK